MNMPPRAVPKWGHDQYVTLTLTGADLLMLSTVYDHMILAGFNEQSLTPACVLSAALDMAVAYIDHVKQRGGPEDGQ